MQVQRSDIVCPFHNFPAFPFVLTSRLMGEVYYLLYVDGCEMQSKVAVDPEEASLGRIRTDAISPPHSSATIKACISRVEKIPELAYANLFADISSNNPLKESYISILRSDCPGLSPKEPMAIVQMADVQDPSIPYGRYAIKNRAADVYWNVLYGQTPIKKVYFGPIAIEDAKRSHKSEYQVNEHSPISSSQGFRE